MILRGDCLETLKTLESNSVDSVVTDPPYGLKFMGKKWDYEVPSVEIWKEVLRVLKPGGHILAACGTRTQHRMAVNIEDAGFEVRDVITYHYGSGFPKSLNVKKAGVKSGNACGCLPSTECEMRPLRESNVSTSVDASNECREVLQPSMSEQGSHSAMLRPESKEGQAARTECGMEGRGDVQANKGKLHRTEVRSVPEGFSGDVSQRRLRDGASDCNGDSSQAPINQNGSCSSLRSQHTKQRSKKSRALADKSEPQVSGAWARCDRCGKHVLPEGLGTALKPATEFFTLVRKPIEGTVAQNVLKYGCGGLNIDATRIEAADQDKLAKNWDRTQSKTMEGERPAYGKFGAIDLSDRSAQGRFPANVIFDETAAEILDAQSIAGGIHSAGKGRAKKENFDRTKSMFGIGHAAGSSPRFEDATVGASRFFYCAKASKSERNAGLDELTNGHPTVKPLKLMQYLIKLITPEGGVCLDPFMGSGSTGVAAKSLGFEFIGCELSPEYLAIAERRIEAAV